MTKKELKEFFESMVLAELKGRYSENQINKEKIKNIIKKDAKALSELDFEDEKYLRKSKQYSDDIKSNVAWIKEIEADEKVMLQVIEKKEKEKQDIEAYNTFIEDNNEALKLLTDAVNERLQQFIKDGCVVYCNDKEIEISLEEAKEIHENLRLELISIVMNYLDSVTEVEDLRYNGNRGFDCSVRGIKNGQKRSISINTIQAGGYNIQKLHYRTLIFS